MPLAKFENIGDLVVLWSCFSMSPVLLISCVCTSNVLDIPANATKLFH